MELMPGKEHEIKIINWKDTTAKSDFALTSYGSKKSIEIQDAMTYLLQDIASNEKSVTTVAGSHGAMGRHVMNKDTQTLTIEVKKSLKAAPARTVMTIKFRTPGFPWRTARANFEWTKGVGARVITQMKHGRQTQYFELQAVCPKAESVCVLQIPDIEYFKSVSLS